MSAKIRGVLPLALSIGVLAFVYVELTLNATFHWFASDDLGIGLSLPGDFHLVTPAGFVSWGFYFAAGAGIAGLRSVTLASIVGSVLALVVMAAVGDTADLPDFWGIALWVGLTAFVAVLMIAAGEWYFVPATFGAFASVIFWWLATGADNWSPGGGGGSGVEALAEPATAGSGAFGGVLSTPYEFVWLSTLATLVLGALFGHASSLLASVLTPAQQEV